MEKKLRAGDKVAFTLIENTPFEKGRFLTGKYAFKRNVEVLDEEGKKPLYKTTVHYIESSTWTKRSGQKFAKVLDGCIKLKGGK